MLLSQPGIFKLVCCEIIQVCSAARFCVEHNNISFAGTQISKGVGGPVCLLKVAAFTSSLTLLKGGSVTDLMARDSSNMTQILVFLTGILDILQ